MGNADREPPETPAEGNAELGRAHQKTGIKQLLWAIGLTLAANARQGLLHEHVGTCPG